MYIWSHTTYRSRFCLVHTLIKNSNEYSNIPWNHACFSSPRYPKSKVSTKKSEHTLNIYINCIKLYYCSLTSTQHPLKLNSFSREKHRYFNDCPWLLTSFPSWDPWLEEPSRHSFTMPASATPTSCSTGGFHSNDDCNNNNNNNNNNHHHHKRNHNSCRLKSINKHAM